jgi:hypothetical protein
MKLIRVNSYNGAIFLMQPVNLIYELAARSFEDVEVELVPFRGSCDFRARKLGEGVKVEAVDHETDGVE